MGRFQVIEYMAFFAVRDTQTGEECHLATAWTYCSTPMVPRSRRDAGLLRDLGRGAQRRRDRDAGGILSRTSGAGKPLISRKAKSGRLETVRGTKSGGNETDYRARRMATMETPPDLRDVQPSSFNHVIGQRHVTQALRIACEAAFAEKKRLDEVLLCGPPGLGKSALVSGVLANELAVECTEVL